jgi:DNA (cytosine-5)-methyltransferase 1
MSKTKYTALGITCGIGSMLGAARKAGFEVLGNHEWRKYYHKKDADGKNTFIQNFPRAYFVDRYPQDGASYPADVTVVFGHPECGSFSALNFSNKNYREAQQTPSDIPLFLHAVSTVKPRFFVMDDLPRAFIGLPMSEYARILPEYDLFPEWISNYHYGNVQLNRKRMFMIGALKTARWAFVPGEAEHDTQVKDVIGDLNGKNYGKVKNHHPHVLNEPCGKIADYYEYGYRGTWKDFQRVMAQRPEGPPIEYVKSDGSTGVRCGTAKVRWEGHGFVLDGGSVCTHPLTNLPLSIRERARIQGFPDDFVFYGIKLDEHGCWNHDKNNDLVKQTGKAMPWQFNEYVARQIKAHVDGKPFKASNARMLEPNEYVSDAKRWYCQNVGYSNQEAACAACWMRQSCGLEQFSGTRDSAEVKVPRAKTVRLARAPKIRTSVVPEGTIFSTLEG